MPNQKNTFRSPFVYIILYVFIFLTILFGIKLITNNVKEEENKKRKRHYNNNNHKEISDNNTIITEITEYTTNDKSTVTEVTELTDNIDEQLMEIIMNDLSMGRSKGERLCRHILEEIYNKPFPSVFPSFLKNPKTPKNLELDGYCEELKMAFEYNGAQHYKHVKRFQPNGEVDLLYQIQKDEFKKKRCKEMGIYLINIPYTVKHKHLKSYIEFHLPENVKHRNSLRVKGYDIPEHWTK